MPRVLSLFVLLALVGCREDPGALQVRIQLEPDVLADCVALDVLSADAAPLQSETVPRAGKNELLVAVFRGGLPDTVQLQARALWGPQCVYNGRGEAQSARFEPKQVGTVLLRLSRPGLDEDADQDGFVKDTLGGPDCADMLAERHPQAQEACDMTVDLNCDGARGCEASTCGGPDACSRLAESLVVRGPDGSPVGECVPLTVERLAANGQPSASTFAVPVTLSVPGDSGLGLYADAACSQPLSALTLRAGAPSAPFFARGERLGSHSVSASAPDFATARLAYELRPGRATQLSFLASNTNVQAGACVALTVERRDAFANLTTFGGAQPISLSLTPATRTGLFLDKDCKNTALPQASFPASATSLTLYFRGEQAGQIAVGLSGTGLTGATRNQQVTPGPPTQLSVTLSGQPLLAGECSPLSAVGSKDDFGNPSVDQTVTVNLSAPAGSNVGFFSNSQCTSGITTTTVRTADGKADFYFKAKKGGTHVISATLGTRTASQSQTITSAVRTGACEIPANQSTVNCALSPGLRELKKSFLIFQATTTDASPRASYVRCSLKDVNTIACARYNGSGAGAARIQWQVVELPQGISVQHVEKSCIAPATSLTFDITPVDLNRSFLLSSSLQDGEVASPNDFVTVRFRNNSQVDVQMAAPGECDKETFSLQVVTFEAGAVFRGVAGAKNGSPLDVTSNYTVEEASRSVLLSTFQSAAPDTDKICNRMVRGAIGPAANTVRFSWGAGNNTCESPGVAAVSWERILLPPTTGVQVRQVNIDNGQAQAIEPLTDVDVTRTLLLASTQVSSGQGNGETDHLNTDIVGVATARLLLDSPTQLRVVRDTSESNASWTVYAIQLEF